MSSKRAISFFLLSVTLMGPGCYAEDPQSSIPSPSDIAASSVQDVTAASGATKATGQWPDGWYEGAEGYDTAVAEYKRTHKPMVVYISVGWCPYCRTFEKEVLSSPLVRKELEDKIKVNINPEAGRREEAIVSRYGIRGFPSFFLHPPQPGRAVQLYTGATPAQFVEFFKQVLQ